MKNLFILILTGYFCQPLLAQETGTFTDTRDGKVYKTVTIAGHCIMAENLSYKPVSGKFWEYEGIPDYIKSYGYLYDWKTATGIAPEGWHLPSREEWQELYEFAGNDDAKVYTTLQDAGLNLLGGGYQAWASLNINEFGYYWSSTGIKGNNACYLLVNKTSEYAYIKCPDPGYIINSANCGYSVRLFKDNDRYPAAIGSMSAAEEDIPVEPEIVLGPEYLGKELKKVQLPLVLTNQDVPGVTLNRLYHTKQKQSLITSFTASYGELVAEGEPYLPGDGNKFIIFSLVMKNNTPDECKFDYDLITLMTPSGEKINFKSFSEFSKDPEPVKMWLSGSASLIKGNSVSEREFIAPVKESLKEILIRYKEFEPVRVEIVE